MFPFFLKQGYSVLSQQEISIFFFLIRPHVYNSFNLFLEKMQ